MHQNYALIVYETVHFNTLEAIFEQFLRNFQ